MRNDILWVEKYRPKIIEDCILPKLTKRAFQEIVKQGEIPHLLLSGTAGTGKTTVSKALANETNYDVLLINASENGNIDTLRTTIRTFASTVSFTGNRKVIILDEADYLNPNSTQPALRGVMEEFAANTAFILTCNFKNRILGPIQSRCSCIDFRIDNAEKPKLAAQFMKRIKDILDQEEVKYSDAVIAELINKFFPDFRRILNELQRYSLGGEIDTGILTQIGEIKTAELVKAMKAKDFDKVRKWTVNNLDQDPSRIFRAIYDSLYDHLVENTIPQAILHLADGQYQSAFSADQEITILATLIKILVDVEFK